MFYQNCLVWAILLNYIFHHQHYLMIVCECAVGWVIYDPSDATAPQWWQGRNKPSFIHHFSSDGSQNKNHFWSLVASDVLASFKSGSWSVPSNPDWQFCAQIWMDGEGDGDDVTFILGFTGFTPFNRDCRGSNSLELFNFIYIFDETIHP